MLNEHEREKEKFNDKISKLEKQIHDINAIENDLKKQIDEHNRKIKELQNIIKGLENQINESK